ncbi:insulinoma-associated protein 1a [Lutzomyia longipalpis]|uniref:insulinoma-associated protein 1a n=1 Tax=Lutzomyia longipalpis TaxID=7200 RepID=UPI002483AB98|nr:insulinoma-associated protein 1a [Lutzomyia longipalpis]
MESQQFVAFRPISTGGLLTTVADLPVSLKRHYTVLTESPLDLSVKPTLDAITPPSTPSPPKKRYRDIEVKLEPKADGGEEVNEKTPKSRPKSSASRSAAKSGGGEHKRTKAVRKLKFDEDTSSPVSGTIIRPFEEIDENNEDQIGDIDPQYNIVEVTEEAKAEIAAIPNVIGAYRCRLCRNEFEDAFGLARHRCSCIVLLEYRCPECGKRFNCPANLASHRRWHKPKEQIVAKRQDTAGESENQFPCSECGKFFKRMAYLRKHMATHTKKDKVVSHSSRSSDSFSDPPRATEERQNITEMIFHYASMRNTPSTTSSSASERSTPSPRMQIIDDAFTEEENLAAAALAHLRNGPSVIRHTTALVV